MPKKLIHSVLNFLFLQKCLGCGKENEILCSQCLERIDYPTLPRSAGPIFAATDYNDKIVKKAIWALKYRKSRQLAKPLAELIHRRISVVRNLASDTVIIPIPLSKKRLKGRGFNQSELIAKYLSDKMSVRMLPDVLYKIKDTPTQVSIKDRTERLNNLKDSFEVKNKEAIMGENIILIDDVATTGSTIKEARKTLRASGAKKIIPIVVARG